MFANRLSQFIRSASTAALFLSLCGHASAQQLTATITVRDAPSAAEQMKQAIHCIDLMHQAATQQSRFENFTAAIKNLELLQERWPSHTAPVLQSAVMIADLALEWRTPGKAIEALQRVERRAGATPYETGVERRLANAFEMRGDATAAEIHYIAAESGIRKNTPVPEKTAALSQFAIFYAHRANPREAVKRFHKLAVSPELDDVQSITYHVAASEEAFQIRDDPRHTAGAEELAQLDARVSAARTHQLTPSDATFINHAALQAQRLRDQYHP